MWPFISVVVPVRNGEETIRDCVTALLDSDYPPEHQEIVVVDNASTDQTRAILADLPVRVLHEPQVGRSHARNRGIRESRGEIIAFTDADCIADHGWLLELAAQLERDHSSCAAGELIASEPRTAAQRFMAGRDPVRQRQALGLPMPFALTSNVAFRREVFERVGLFDPEFVTGEDVDFGWRCLAAGFEFSYCPNAIVAHRLRPTAWALFRQQAGLGYGRATLRERHNPSHGVGIPTWGAVLRSGVDLLRHAGRRPGTDAVSSAAYELLLRLGLRLGALRRELGGKRGARTGSCRALTAVDAGTSSD
jgi:glycosyltransferase involved in cell wall biosynthesis